MDKKVSGVMMDTSLARDEKEEKTRDDMHEINLKSVSDHGQRETAEEEEIEKLPS